MTENSSPALNAMMPVKTQYPLHLSKKRYHQIKEAAYEFFPNEISVVDKFLEKMCELLQFDPEKGIYTREMGRVSMQRVKEKAAELGISVYEASGVKKYYLEHKEELSKKRSEYYYRRKNAKTAGEIIESPGEKVESSGKNLLEST